jgi:hypothetical protein
VRRLEFLDRVRELHGRGLTDAGIDPRKFGEAVKFIRSAGGSE